MSCVGEGCIIVIDTSPTLLLALIGCFDLGAVDSCKWNYDHWMDPETLDCFTVNLFSCHHILLSSANFGKYNKKRVTYYSFKLKLTEVYGIHHSLFYIEYNLKLCFLFSALLH